MSDDRTSKNSPQQWRPQPMSDDLAARIVEAAARAICRAPDPQAEECPCKMNHAMSVYRCCKGPVRDARAAIAAAVRESGVDLQRMRDDADWIEESSAYLVGSAVEGFASPDPLAALLRALAGIADAR